MTSLQELTYLVGSPQDKCKLMKDLEDLRKLEEIWNLYKSDPNLINLAHLNLIQNPQASVQLLCPETLMLVFKRAEEEELTEFLQCLQTHKPINLEVLQLMFHTLSRLIISPSVISPKVMIPIPGALNHSFYHLVHQPVMWSRLLNCLIHHPQYQPNFGLILEEYLMFTRPKKAMASLIPGLLQVSRNPKFIDKFLNLLVLKKRVQYSLRDLLRNPHLSSGHMKTIRSKLKYHPHLKLIGFKPSK